MTPFEISVLIRRFDLIHWQGVIPHFGAYCFSTVHVSIYLRWLAEDTNKAAAINTHCHLGRIKPPAFHFLSFSVLGCNIPSAITSFYI